MSWKKIARPDALPRGAEVHRREAAEKLVDFYTGGQARGDLGDRIDFLTSRVDRAAADLVRDIGTVKEVARLTGAAERTVRDWRAGAHSPSPQHRAALEQVARKSTVDVIGGTRAVADLSGRTESSVRGWIRQRTTVKGDAAHRLNRYEVRDRHARARQQQGQDPSQPLYLKARGHVRVRASTATPQYDADRTICVELKPDMQELIEDAIARDDPELVHQLIEGALTGPDYARLGDIYDGENFGFFLDRVDQTWMLDHQVSTDIREE